MKHFSEFLKDKALFNEHFMILGKGPSISKVDTLNYKGMTISLNHVVRDHKVDISHIIDLDVVEDLGGLIETNADYLLMPLYPHIDSKPTNKGLLDIIPEMPVLKRLYDEDRLLWYNLSTKRFVRNSYPIYPAGFFSGDSVIGMLASAGISNVTMAGVDGGGQYSEGYSDLNQKTLFKNGRKSFDIQFSNIRQYIMKNDLNFNHINDEHPIKVYIASTEAQMLATKVLEYSIRARTKSQVEVVALHTLGIDYADPECIENRQRTPFSFQRFLIPEICDFQGKAIYLDSDMQVFDDIKKLWTLPMGDKSLLAVKSKKGEGRKPHFSVMLIDCYRNKWSINSIVNSLNNGDFSYSELMDGMVVSDSISAEIPSIWNSLELYEKNKTKLIHYTDMKTQPWVSTKNPYESIWVEELINAVADGFISLSYLREHMEKGWIRPSLLDQVQLKVPCSKDLPRDIKSKDRGYKPPYEELICGYSSVSSSKAITLIVKLKKLFRYFVRD